MERDRPGVAGRLEVEVALERRPASRLRPWPAVERHPCLLAQACRVPVVDLDAVDPPRRRVGREIQVQPLLAAVLHPARLEGPAVEIARIGDTTPILPVPVNGSPLASTRELLRGQRHHIGLPAHGVVRPRRDAGAVGFLRPGREVRADTQRRADDADSEQDKDQDDADGAGAGAGRGHGGLPNSVVESGRDGWVGRADCGQVGAHPGDPAAAAPGRLGGASRSWRARRRSGPNAGAAAARSRARACAVIDRPSKAGAHLLTRPREHGPRRGLTAAERGGDLPPLAPRAAITTAIARIGGQRQQGIAQPRFDIEPQVPGLGRLAGSAVDEAGRRIAARPRSGDLRDITRLAVTRYSHATDVVGRGRPGPRGRAGRYASATTSSAASRSRTSDRAKAFRSRA